MHKANNIELPACRNCPSRNFELAYVSKCSIRSTRYIAICHAVEAVLRPVFPNSNIHESIAISKANMQTVTFIPVYNCPHLQKLRDEGKIITSIDYRVRKWERKKVAR